MGKNATESQVIIDVTAHWRPRDGEDVADANEWGMAEVNALQGGQYYGEWNPSTTGRYYPATGLVLMVSTTVTL